MSTVINPNNNTIQGNVLSPTTGFTVLAANITGPSYPTIASDKAQYQTTDNIILTWDQFADQNGAQVPAQVQVATDQNFQNVVHDEQTGSNRLQLSPLPAGQYWVRARWVLSGGSGILVGPTT